MDKVNLAKKLSLFNDYFNPRIVGELSQRGSLPWQVKLVKFKGEFVWHHHEAEDELFYVVKGSFDMQLRGETITVNAGEFVIVPKGVEHCPRAEDEVEIMLFEPASVLNTGNVNNELTVEAPRKI